MQRGLLALPLVLACGDAPKAPPDAGPAHVVKKEESPTILGAGCPPIAVPKRKPLSEPSRDESNHVFLAELPDDRAWEQSELLKSINPNERFKQIRTSASDGKTRFLFVSTSEEDQCERFYELEEGSTTPHLIATDPAGGVGVDELAVADGTFLFQLGKSVYKYKVGSRARPVGSTPGELDTAAKAQNLTHGVAETQSPNKGAKISLSGSQVTLYGADNQRDVLVRQDFAGAWSIGQSAWSDDSNTLFFDNSGKNACIWEVHLPTKRLSKIIPEHLAESPWFFRKDGQEALAYVEADAVRMAVRKGPPRDQQPPWKVAPTAAEIDDMIGGLASTEWLRATNRGSEVVVEEWCTSDVPSISVRKAKNKGFPELEFGYGQDVSIMRIVYMARRADDLLVVFEDPEAKEKVEGYRIQLRSFEGLDRVTWGRDTRGGDFGKDLPYVAKSALGKYVSEKVEDCEEMFANIQANAGPILDKLPTENGSLEAVEILGADLGKEKLAFRAFFQAEGAVECEYTSHPKAGEIVGIYDLEKDKITTRVEVRASATAAAQCTKDAAGKEKAAIGKLGKVVGKGTITSVEGGVLVVPGKSRKVRLTAKSGVVDATNRAQHKMIEETQEAVFGALYNGKNRVYVRHRKGTQGTISFPAAVVDGDSAAFVEAHDVGGKLAISVSPVLPIKEL